MKYLRDTLMSKYLLKTRQLDLNFKRQNWLSQMQTHLNEGRFGDDWTKYSHFPFYIGFYILDYTAVKLLCLFHATYVAEITCACCFFFFFCWIQHLQYKHQKQQSPLQHLFSRTLVCTIYTDFCLICCAISRDNNQCFDLNSREHLQSEIMSNEPEIF